MIIQIQEYKGRPIIAFKKSEGDTFPALSMGVRKAEICLMHLNELVKFVSENGGEVPVELCDRVDAPVVAKRGKKSA
jgi:hypothetical protein